MEKLFFGEYYAGLNCGSGFANYFQNVLEGIERIYILKGSPGSGKSNLMKRIASSSAEKGIRAEKIYCSADTHSLDGVVMRDLSVAVIDGTAPHSSEPKYPGAVEKIINLGECWNDELLIKSKDKIMELSRKKSASYAQAYTYLAGKRELREARGKLLAQAVNAEKLESFVQRTLKKEANGSGAVKPKIRVCAALSGSGICVKNTFAAAKKTYALRESHDTARLLLDALLVHANKNGTPTVISPDPYDTEMTAAVYFTESNVLFVKEEYCVTDEYKTINMERFVNKDAVKLTRTKERFMKKCESVLEDGAREALAEARALHEQLEQIYVAAMNFTCIDEITAHLEAEITG